ncbi:MAG: hypothetical protein Q9160_007280 [Pyrenula sp. 1 TL-2023]
MKLLSFSRVSKEYVRTLKRPGFIQTSTQYTSNSNFKPNGVITKTIGVLGVLYGLKVIGSSVGIFSSEPTASDSAGSADEKDLQCLSDDHLKFLYWRAVQEGTRRGRENELQRDPSNVGHT